MINKKNIIRASDDDETKIFISKSCDSYMRAFNTGRTFFSKFATPLEQKIIESRFPKNDVEISFFGGYDDSERNIIRFSGDAVFDDALSYPVCAVSVRAKSREVFSHRDYLGSVLGLGIKRELIGDIVIRSEDAVIFCLEEIAPYIEDNLFKIGHATVNVTRLDDISDIVIERKFENLSLTVSSMRADCVVSAVCNVSRSGASELIERGLVTLCYEVLASKDRLVNPGDVISVRGKGKFMIGDEIKPTKKGRLHIDVKKYI